MQKHEKNVVTEEAVDEEYMLEAVPQNKRRSTYSQIMVSEVRWLVMEAHLV